MKEQKERGLKGRQADRKTGRQADRKTGRQAVSNVVPPVRHYWIQPPDLSLRAKR